MTDNELKLNELKEVNGGAFIAPLHDKNTVSEKAVCQQCRHDLAFRSSMNREQSNVFVCTNPNCPDFNKERKLFAGAFL
jgi:predicted RNA-binding Zn-ribbon protein involved in translation (DUF1610 family)